MFKEYGRFKHSCVSIHFAWDGGTVRVWDCNNAIQQLWYYDTSTNEIKNKAGRCLDVHYDDYHSKTNGALVQIWKCNEQDNQKWIINGNQIKSSNGKCLDIHWDDYVANNNGGEIQLWDCNGQDNQGWIL
eukprot:515664_1